jgi:hypothetical protein
MSAVNEGLAGGGRVIPSVSGDGLSERNDFAVIDGKTGIVEQRSSKINLSTLDDVRLEMSKVYRSMKSGDRECQDGTRLVYVLGQIAKLHEITEVANRLAALERAVVPRRRK